MLRCEVRISTGGVGVFEIRFGSFSGLNGVSRGALGIFIAISEISLREQESLLLEMGSQSDIWESLR